MDVHDRARSRSPRCTPEHHGAEQISSLAHLVAPSPTGETKLVGVIGGIFPPSTVEYYNALNSFSRRRLGGTHNCNVLIWSLDQHPMVAWSKSSDEGWAHIAERLQLAASGLERAGVVCIVIACNSVHKVFDKVVGKVGVPILHIADATASVIKNAQVESVGKPRRTQGGISSNCNANSNYEDVHISLSCLQCNVMKLIRDDLSESRTKFFVLEFMNKIRVCILH